ncbi:hypothetical protein HY29_13430 [Hyphomonas beringensis]|uniref:Uncharacterized protein n=1 Tax=Hyphomonas beringensis TaxID=1280946 RepID=A0A062UFB0_9PROT|nr:hypothetical protein [Hyphomonas beringensis]KCZ54795.1 hypothetical protein HY29_13430 [Hyphomonas beringensis]
MSDTQSGKGDCYICGYPLDPLTSICPNCNYSQTPNPAAQGSRSGAVTQPEMAPDDSPPNSAAANLRKTLRKDLDARMSDAKANLKSKLKKK